MRPATLSSGLLLAAARVALVRADDSGTAWCTPHDSYSSSVGVLGCKINTNRVAYWPGTVDCTNLCVEVSYSGRSVYLLRIDQSGGAHDISYDAWNYLITGQSAAKKPTTGGATAMTYQNVDASKCASLIKTKGGKLPLSAANSMDFLASCLADESSWVAKHYVLYNILDPICTWGYDETCKLDWPNANQAACPHTLGEPVALTKDPVWNIQYGTGKSVLAGSSPSSTTPNSLSNAATSAGQTVRQPGVNLLAAVIAVSGLFIHSLLDFL